MSKAIEVLDEMVAELWRQVDVLSNDVAKKTAHISRLRVERKVPMGHGTYGDYPIDQWIALAERHRSIDNLIEARRRVERRPKPKRRASP